MNWKKLSEKFRKPQKSEKKDLSSLASDKDKLTKNKK